MKLIEFAIKNGSRKAAFKLLDISISNYCGLTHHDLPDTVEMCNTADELEGIIEDGIENGSIDFDNIKDILKEFNDQIEDMIYFS